MAALNGEEYGALKPAFATADMCSMAEALKGTTGCVLCSMLAGCA
jgi:hypothetical protein